MSGVAGADRVKSRLDFQQFLASYQHLLGQFPGFVSMKPSGSYNSNPDKQDFGDIDLIVHIQSEKDKATLKKELQAFFMKQPETVIVPFSSAKHAGKRTYNAGELVSVRFHDNALGYSAQIDNIVALDHLEAGFKQQFLDMPAEIQGLVLGLVKIATIETEPAILFQKLGIKAQPQLEPDQEYEFNLSGVELQLRKVTYEPGTFKQVGRDIIWSSRNYDDLQKLLYQYDLKTNFDSLLQQAKQNIRNPRSNQRMQGVFSSMISVKSGEVGTPKGADKEAALARVQQAFGESRRSIFRSLMESNNKTVAFAFGRFQPPTIGHELLIVAVKEAAARSGADHVIYVSKTQDAKTNPLDIGTKMAYLQKMFPGTNFVAADATVRTPVEAIKHLNQKYNGLIWVAGSDRLPVFTKLANDYNGKEYQYQNIQVISSGARDPDSEGTEGMSGTKMRSAALEDNLQEFMQGLPGNISEQDAMKLMNLIKQGMQKPVKAAPGPKLPNTTEATFKKSPYGRTAASQQRAKDLLNPPKPPAPKKDEQGVAEGSEDKIKQLKQDHAAAVHWSKNDTNPHKREEAARQKAEKIKAHLEKQYKQGVAEGLNDTQKKIEDTINKLEDRLKHAKSDEQWDRISARIERLQAGLKRSKQGVAEGAPIVVMPSPERLKKAELPKQRYMGDIVPPTQPPSTEKRGVKGRPGQRPMPDQGVAERMMPASNFAGTPKNKLGSAGQLKGNMKRPARAGDLVGGAEESIEREEKQRLDPSCWKGYRKSGTKMKGDTRVNNCVPVSEDVQNIMDALINKIIFNEAVSNKRK